MKYITILVGLLLSLVCLGQLVVPSHSEPLPADQAFQFSAAARDSQTVLLRWNIAPDYFLYQKRFHFSVVKPQTTELGTPLFPQAETKPGLTTGTSYQIFKGMLTIPIPVLHPQNNFLLLKVNYQGCSAGGFCYPPAAKMVSINLSGNYMNFVQGVPADVTETEAQDNNLSHIEKLLMDKNFFVVLLLFLGFGLLISFTPCILPMIPILSGIILGHDSITHRRAFMLSLTYVLGMAITYAIAGVLFGFLGGSLQAALQKPWILAIFSVIFVLMALSLFGFFNLEPPEKWRGYFAHLSQEQKRGTYVGTALMGCFSTLILSPCVTPPLVAVLGYISRTGNALLGGVALFTMGIGMGIPLIIIGTGGAKFLPKTGMWMVTIKNLLGILLLAVAIWMVARVIPGPLSMLLWALLAIGTAIYWGALNSTQTHWETVSKTLGLVLFVYGIVLIIGAAQGSSNPLHPLYLGRGVISSSDKLSFQAVKTIEDVNQALSDATRQNKVAILDFYADWCVSCVQMDHYTFDNFQVKNSLKQFVLLRANVTANDMNDKLLQQHFHVVAPPTIIFFNSEGDEIKDSRIVGEISANAFLQHLKTVKKETISIAHQVQLQPKKSIHRTAHKINPTTSARFEKALT